MQLLKTIFSDTLHLFYPHNCSGCGSDLIENNNFLCLKCFNDLPHTNFAKHVNNPVEKIFWGRIPVKAAHSEFYFTKESVIQRLIHRLKYEGDTEIGFYLGQIIGKSILESNRFKEIDGIIPLPLFPEKEKIRGYNQSAVIAKGIASAYQIPVLENCVIRKRYTETQTRKHRTERWENVENSFFVTDPSSLKNKNILLVDDVITTGASLEACGNTILQIENTSLYFATLAIASK